MYEVNINGWSLVLVGYWNSQIFTPQWISHGNLTDSTNVTLEVPLNEPQLPLRFNFDNIYLQVSDKRIDLKPQDDEDSTLIKIEQVAKTILDKLEHTPVSAVGVNFQYMDASPSDDIVKVFQFEDNDYLSALDYEIEANTIGRKLKKNGHVINLTLVYNIVEKLTFDFNFHESVSIASEASVFLDNKVLEFRNESIEIINKYYTAEE